MKHSVLSGIPIPKTKSHALLVFYPISLFFNVRSQKSSGFGNFWLQSVLYIKNCMCILFDKKNLKSPCLNQALGWHSRCLSLNSKFQFSSYSGVIEGLIFNGYSVKLLASYTTIKCMLIIKLLVQIFSQVHSMLKTKERLKKHFLEHVYFVRAVNNIWSKQLIMNSRLLCPMEGHPLCVF